MKRVKAGHLMSSSLYGFLMSVKKGQLSQKIEEVDNRTAFSALRRGLCVYDGRRWELTAVGYEGLEIYLYAQAPLRKSSGPVSISVRRLLANRSIRRQNMVEFRSVRRVA